MSILDSNEVIVMFFFGVERGLRFTGRSGLCAHLMLDKGAVEDFTEFLIALRISNFTIELNALNVLASAVQNVKNITRGTYSYQQT